MSTLPSSLPFPRLQIAKLEGRGQSTLLKRAQFRRLHNALTTSAPAIKLAIQADSGHTVNEVELEFTLAISGLRNLFTSLDLAQDLESLRAVTKGRDNVERTKPVGIVYIVPAAWSLFYSVISPLGAALAAGNCVILELPQTLGHVSSILRRLLLESLDADVFAISTSPPARMDVTSQWTLVMQGVEDVDRSRWSQVISPPQHSGTIVVIDRTADVIKTAEMIVNASFAFQGNSPYSPRMVLVDEFICDQLLSALAAHVVDSKSGNLKSDANQPYERRQKGIGLTEKASVKNVISGSNGSIIEHLAHLDSTLLEKLEGPLVMVRRVSSLKDAISMLADSGTFAACFAFGGVAEANYITTYIDAHLSTINYIPIELLVGPVAPAHPSKGAAPSPRYIPSLFTRPNPQYLRDPSRLTSLALSQNQGDLELRNWSEAVMKPLTEETLPKRVLLNFFGTGIMIGLSTIALCAVGMTSGACWISYKTYRAW